MREIVIDANGRLRTAGTVGEATSDIEKFRTLCERSLFFFGYAILGLDRLTARLHKPVMEWLSDLRQYRRKGLLMPRDHLKTSMIRAMAAHMLIQPDSHNLYFPGKDGRNTRILYGNETATNAKHQVRWLEHKWDNCELLRALWPHCVWRRSRRDSRKWNEEEMLIPRPVDYPEATVEAIGVDGAVTSRHYDVLLKDDLITFEAANSPAVMQTAIRWNKATRPLMDDDARSIEVTVGTRWANYDLYQDLFETDDSIEWTIRAAVENGAVIFPEHCSLASLERLRKSLGPLYYLLYMNSPSDPSLVDFNVEQLRRCGYDPARKELILTDSPHDEALLAYAEHHSMGRGLPLTDDLLDRTYGRKDTSRYRPYAQRRPWQQPSQ